MVKNWQSFNESIINSEFTIAEYQAFISYIKDKVLSNNTPENRILVKRISDELISEINNEFELKIEDFDIKNIMFGSVNVQNGQFLGVMGYDKMEKVYGGLSKNNFKPGFVVCFDINSDEFNKRKDRYFNYFNRFLENEIDIPENIKCKLTKINTSNSGGGSYRSVSIMFELNNFEFVDIFEKDNVIDFLEEHPEHINGMYDHGDKDEIFDFICDNKLAKKSLSGQKLLDFLKKEKDIKDPKRREMEEENKMYVFISRPKFVIKENGDYKRDIDIENMVPIDPYNSNDLLSLNMMHIRARNQGEQSEVYCIWLPIDAYSEDDLSNINEPEFEYLRKLIDEKKERI